MNPCYCQNPGKSRGLYPFFRSYPISEIIRAFFTPLVRSGAEDVEMPDGKGMNTNLVNLVLTPMTTQVIPYRPWRTTEI